MTLDDRICPEGEVRWHYERGEGRRKHRWGKDYAGFVPGEKGPIGKCPSSIDQATAEILLNRGVPFYESPDAGSPARIYSVHRGVIYESVPTTPGESYHGYPWRGDLPGRSPLPRAILKQLQQQAESTNDLQAFKLWLRKYGRRQN